MMGGTDLIATGGKNVNHSEIKGVLPAHPAVPEAAVLEFPIWSGYSASSH
jgi:acyl-CoA synthetase (AMP-forming)/AMP-acid ligase II